MTPLEENPPVVSMRSSRRVRGEDSSILDGHSTSAALKKLALGGHGGRANKDGMEWKFHLSEVQPKQSTSESVPLKNGRHRLVDLEELEDTLNLLKCTCPENDMSKFIEYCVENDPSLSKERMDKLWRGWKISESKGKHDKNITINANSLGFASSLDVQCKECKGKAQCKAKQAKNSSERVMMGN